MDIDEEEAAWDVVRDQINLDVESGEFVEINKKAIEFKSAYEVGTSELVDDTAEEEEEGEEETGLLDLDSQQQQPSTSSASTTRRKRSRKARPYNYKHALNPVVPSLLGQANLEHARGHSKQAMAILFEAIKLSPYHAQTYKELSDIYAEQAQLEKSFEFKMLAALLTDKTPAEEWDAIAELAQQFGRLELAVASLARAIRRDPGNWVYYEKRIQILDASNETDLAMRTRLQAAQHVNNQTSQINFEWIDKQIKTAADYYCTLKDEERAIEALELFILRSREFQRPIGVQHLALLGEWMRKHRWEESARSILALNQHALCPMDEEGTPAIRIEFTQTGYLLAPFPPPPHVRWFVSESLPTLFLSHLITCLVHLRLFHLIPGLVDRLLERPVLQEEEENAFLVIARALHVEDQVGLAVEFMTKLRAAREEFSESADAWFLHGFFHQVLDQVDVAREAYQQVIAIQPDHVDARINLSTILQQMGQGEQALEILKDLTWGAQCSQIPDERLLLRQAEMLLEQHKSEQYISCLRMLLIPHFYEVHQMAEVMTRTSRRKIALPDKVLHMALKRRALEAIQGSPLERMVKRLGAVAWASHRPVSQLNAHELHDYAFRLAESLHLAGCHGEMLVVVCYAFLHSKVAVLGSQRFNNLLFFAAVNARDFPLAFEFLRFHMTYTLPRLPPLVRVHMHPVGLGEPSPEVMLVPSGSVLSDSLKRVFVAMNYVFCQHQNVNYHRFVMRQLVKQPDSDALHVISGNNSLVTGAYRHALGEYFSVWLRQRDNPLLAFLIALTFGHIACKKDISSRHVVGLRAFAFMSKYAELRAPSLCQEVQYNTGRLFHQMGLLPNAIKCYERVLYECPTPHVWVDDPGGLQAPRAEVAERYDLKRQAAYNLSLIYESSGNRLMARHILEQFCTI